MALFQISPTRYTDTAQVVDIEYIPRGSRVVAWASGVPPPQEHPPQLRLRLKGGEEIELDAESADSAWDSFQYAMKQTTERQC